MLKTLALLLAMTMAGAPSALAGTCKGRWPEPHHKICKVERPERHRKICKVPPKHERHRRICRNDRDNDRDDHHHRRHHRHTSAFCPGR